MADLIDRFLNLTTTLQTGVVPTTGFGAALIADGNSSLNGDDYRVYLNLTAVSDDLAAGYISAVAAAYLTAMLSARKFATPIYLCQYDDSGGDDPSDAYPVAQAAMLAADLAAPYWIGTTSRAAADIVAAVGWLSADSFPHYGIFQQADADSLTSGYPAAFSTIQTNSRKTLIYTATGTKYLDADCIAYQSGTNPETIALGGQWRMGSTQVGDTVTDAQAAFARTNGIEVGYQLRGATGGSTPTRAYDLLAVGGASAVPLYLQYTADYWYSQFRTWIASRVDEYITRNARFPGGDEGAALITGGIASVSLAMSGTGNSAFLTPSFAEGFDGQPFRINTLVYSTSTRQFSGEVDINVRQQVASINLDAIFGTFTAD